MTKDEALKMAIEVIEAFGRGCDCDDYFMDIASTIDACKEALEQSKQFLGMKEIPYKDWVLRFYKMPNDLWYTEGINEEWMNEMFEASKPQPAQEPVAYCKHGVPKGVCRLGERDCNPASSWQGLSDDEIDKLYADWERGSWDYITFADSIEQVLKEKNT